MTITQITAKKLMTSITICVVLVSFFTQPSPAQTIDKIVAVVNGEAITQSDIDRVLATVEAEYKAVYDSPEELAQKLKEIGKNIINQMVEEKLVLSEAKKYDIKSDGDEIDARIEQIRKNFPDEEEFERALDAQGLTLKDLRDRFANQQIMKKVVEYFVRAKIAIDPRELRQYYQAHQKDLSYPEKAKVRNILIRVDESCDEYEALQRARTVLEQLKKGKSFEELAKSYSQGANAEEGGEMGFIEKGAWIKEIDKVIFSLDPGEFTDVIKTHQGYRIFKVEEKKPEKTLIFSEAQDTIRQILYREKFAELFKEWIESLKQDAYISIKDE